MILMYVVPVTVAESKIDGKGVFARFAIAKGSVAWIYKEGYDIQLTPNEYDSLPAVKKIAMDKTGYLSPWSGLWIFPPNKDPAQFTNHSLKNNLSVIYDSKVSPEPYFIANKDIEAGEELTNNYYEFDAITRQTKPTWAK